MSTDNIAHARAMAPRYEIRTTTIAGAEAVTVHLAPTHIMHAWMALGPLERRVDPDGTEYGCEVRGGKGWTEIGYWTEALGWAQLAIERSPGRSARLWRTPQTDRD